MSGFYLSSRKAYILFGNIRWNFSFNMRMLFWQIKQWNLDGCFGVVCFKWPTLLVVMTAILLLQGAVSEEVYNDVYDRHKFAYMLRHKTQVHVAAIRNQLATFRTPWEARFHVQRHIQGQIQWIHQVICCRRITYKARAHWVSCSAYNAYWHVNNKYMLTQNKLLGFNWA